MDRLLRAARSDGQTPAEKSPPAMGVKAENSTLAGRFVVEHPTLLNLGFEWEIRGDADRECDGRGGIPTVAESDWRQALPLVRIGGENVYRRRENLDYTVPDGFAGSILNLQPGTEYECRFDWPIRTGRVARAAHRAKVKTHLTSRSLPRKGVSCMFIPQTIKGPARNPASRASCRHTTAGGLATGVLSGNGRAATGRYNPDACRTL